MAKYVLSAFADECSPQFDGQIKGLLDNGVKFMEIRGIEGKGIADYPVGQVKEFRKKLDDAGLAVSSIGSPIGKYSLDASFDDHLEALRRNIECAHIFGTQRIRMFSFYVTKDQLDEKRGEVMYRLGKMLDVAKAEDVLLCCENESRLYGESPERSLDIWEYFGGEIRMIFDPANFIVNGYKTYPDAFHLLKDKIYYFHIKDATYEGKIRPAGDGEGGIPQMIEELKDVDTEYYLTVEPHLQVFDGLDKLENKAEPKKIVDQYASKPEAFAAAVAAIKRYI